MQDLKARLVVKGFTKKHGVDFNDLFCLVVCHTSICVLLVLVALRDLELEQPDVKTAFLHGELQEQIFMQLEGFVVSGKKDYVCHLKMSLYELKPSLRQWRKRFDSFMVEYSYFQSQYDNCVYHKNFSH